MLNVIPQSVYHPSINNNRRLPYNITIIIYSIETYNKNNILKSMVIVFGGGSSQGDRVGRGAPYRLLVDGHVRAVRHVRCSNRFAGKAPAVMAAAASVRDVLVAAAPLVTEQLFQAHDGGQGQRQFGDDQRLAGQQGEHSESQRYGHSTHHERVHEQRVVLVALFATFNRTTEK